jgi:hypothetical protein
MQVDGLGAFEVTLPNLNSIQIGALLRNMDTSMRRHRRLKRQNPPEFRKLVEEENPLLLTNYYAIFEMHFEGKLDSTFFDMLKLRRRVELGELTEEQASVIVGQQLFNRFAPEHVRTAASGPPPLSYEDYYKQYERGPENQGANNS